MRLCIVTPNYMGIFDRITKKKAAPKAEEKKSTTAEVAKTDAVAATIGGNSWRTLTTPRISEKAAFLASKGTYVFNVPISANKIEIGKAVESLYKVHVESVRTVRGIGKFVARGRIRGQRTNWKKALVTLKKGEKIDLYEGV